MIDAQNNPASQLTNKLVEQMAGEGKSRVIAVVNCYLALKGYEVFSGCYSTYLS